MGILSASATGKIVSISEIRNFDTKKGQGGTRTIVIKNNDEYGNTLQFEHTKIGEYYKYIDGDWNFKVGDDVCAEINVETISYQKKDGSGEGLFTKVSAWKLSNNEMPNSSGGQVDATDGVQDESIGEDDLPF